MKRSGVSEVTSSGNREPEPRTGPPPALRHLQDDLASLEIAGLLRTPHVVPPGALSFCSNDYLGLAGRTAPLAEVGAGASRLVSGNHCEHLSLEEALCSWLGLEASLVFSSGYAANVGILSALVRPEDVVVSDILNHASLIDGARLSRARVVVVPHLDLDATQRALHGPRSGRAWVVTESYFSMDADGPDLRRLRALCDEEGAALVVDEAHALGVLGPAGRGRCAEAEIFPDVLVGTFGKAFGASGAFVAGCKELRLWLWNRARSFVFSTGMSPAVGRSARDAIEHARLHPELRSAVAMRAEQLRAGLASLGIAALGFGHIVPWVVGDPRQAVRFARLLQDRGIFVQAIRPPSVPEGTARLRFTVTASHSAHDVDAVVRAVEEARACVGA